MNGRHADGVLSDHCYFSAAQGNVRLHEFGEELRTVIQTIVPNKTPIHLIMYGYSDERVEDTSAGYSGFRIGPAPLEVSVFFLLYVKTSPMNPITHISMNVIKACPHKGHPIAPAF